MALHGFPRYTGDMDFFVAIDQRNAAALIRVFQDFGFGDVGLTGDDFLTEDFVVRWPRRQVRVLLSCPELQSRMSPPHFPCSRKLTRDVSADTMISVPTQDYESHVLSNRLSNRRYRHVRRAKWQWAMPVVQVWGIKISISSECTKHSRGFSGSDSGRNSCRRHPEGVGHLHRADSFA